jgi:hypothetical protein
MSTDDLPTRMSRPVKGRASVKRRKQAGTQTASETMRELVTITAGTGSACCFSTGLLNPRAVNDLQSAVNLIGEEELVKLLNERVKGQDFEGKSETTLTP